MSVNTHPVDRKLDLRVRRTRDRLGDALIELIQERPFESLTVQHVLDRAEVSRTAFYTHFRDKDDLLLSDSDDFFAAMATRLSRDREPGDRIAPVREFFAHVAEARRLVSALIASGRFGDIMELCRGHFARGIERRLGEVPRARGLDPALRPALAHAQAGAMLSLLAWWVDRGMSQPPEAMDALYHRLAWGGMDRETGRAAG